MSDFDEGLYFNSTKYNFWPIYDCISKFYPLGLRKADNEMYLSYPGSKAMEALIEEHFHDSENRIWTNFRSEIETKTEHPIIGTTYGQAPCYGLYIELEKSMVRRHDQVEGIALLRKSVGTVLHNNWAGQK